MPDNDHTEVRRFVANLLAEAGDEAGFADDELLFDNTRLDSLALLHLTLWLEEYYGIDFSRLVLDVGHFESVERIIELIERHGAVGDGRP